MARAPKETTAPPEEEAPARGRKKLVVIAAVVLVAVLAAYFLLFRGGGDAKAVEKPKPGEVVKLDPIQVNLKDGHYLRFGMALQATLKAKEPPEGSRALDAAIELFSGRTMAELGSAQNREKAKKALKKEVSEAYEHEVMDVYFTEFVMQ